MRHAVIAFLVISFILVYVLYCVYAKSTDLYWVNVVNAVVGTFSIMGVVLSIYIFNITNNINQKLKFVDVIRLRNFMDRKTAMLQKLEGYAQLLSYDIASLETFNETKMDLLKELSQVAHYKTLMDESNSRLVDNIIANLEQLEYGNEFDLKNIRNSLAKLIGYLQSGFEEEIGLEGVENAKI